MTSFRLTPDAIDDLEAIWLFIFKDNPDAADAVEEEIRSACAMLVPKLLRSTRSKMEFPPGDPFRIGRLHHPLSFV
jgi:plasmid stabilization system protein ParE